MGFFTTKENYRIELDATNLRIQYLHSEEYDAQSFDVISRNNRAALNQAKLKDIYLRLNELFNYFSLSVEQSFEWNKEFTQAFFRDGKSKSDLKNLKYPIEFLDDETVIIPIYGSAEEKFICLGFVQVDFTGKKSDVYSNNLVAALVNQKISSDEIERPMPGWQTQGTIVAIILMTIVGFMIGASIDGSDYVVPVIGAYVGMMMGFLAIPFANFFMQLTNSRPNDKQNIENVIEHAQSLQVEPQRQSVFAYQGTPDVLPPEYAAAMQRLYSFGSNSQDFAQVYPPESTNCHTVITHSFVQQPAGYENPYLPQPVAHFDGYADQSQQPFAFQPVPYDWQPQPGFDQPSFYIPEQGQGVYPTPPEQETMNPYASDYFTIVNSPIFSPAAPHNTAVVENQYDRQASQHYFQPKW